MTRRDDVSAEKQGLISGVNMGTLLKKVSEKQELRRGKLVTKVVTLEVIIHKKRSWRNHFEYTISEVCVNGMLPGILPNDTLALHPQMK